MWRVGFVLKCTPWLSGLALSFLIGVPLAGVKKFRPDLSVCLTDLSCSSLALACSCSLVKFSSILSYLCL